MGAAQVDTAELRKARGAFFTPPELCSYVARWAIRTGVDRILEPSCGDAAFLTAAGAQVRALGAPATTSTALVSIDQVHGVELHEASAKEAALTLAKAGVQATILTGDFFDLDPTPSFDAVVGNPPYIRYQDFTGEARAKAQRRALEAGRPMSGLASSWAPFLLHASRFLAPGGRLGLVLPAELLSVNYAAPIRAHLMENFDHVEIVLFDDRVFPGVTEEIVLLLAEGPGGHTDRFTIRQFNDLAQLDEPPPPQHSWAPPNAAGKWVPALLDESAGRTYAELLESSFSPLSTWGHAYLGMVTGNNKYFTLTTDEVAARGLNERDLTKVSPPGSRHLRGATFTERAWRELNGNDARTWLFYPRGDDLSDAAAEYIRYGEEHDVHTAYKCRVRSPWWRVPMLPVADLLLTYMNHDTPRLVRNAARVVHLNSIHGVRLHRGHRTIGRELLPIAALNSMTMLGAEMEGRAYGGGILKLEPKEAELLPLPSPALLSQIDVSLRAVAPQLGAAMRGGELDAAVDLVDRVVLVEGAGLKRTAVRQLRAARVAMFNRRSARH
ncbi:MAG: N-6 DNA methylase [Acidimicrobiia bacterium]|nr:N-6 DNA methylase [Acidimicrobiia bacterium]